MQKKGQNEGIYYTSVHSPQEALPDILKTSKIKCKVILQKRWILFLRELENYFPVK
jgi:hypothetical protein